MTNPTATVKIWGDTAGYISMQNNRIFFQYAPEFLKRGIELSPIRVPLNKRVYNFTSLNNETFKGLPGFIADSLPDKFGTMVLNQWLARQGRPENSYNTIERLLFQGNRSMGALEFEPDLKTIKTTKEKIEIEELVKAASEVLTKKSALNTNFKEGDDALETILKIGTSAGGARPKAIVAYNKETQEVLSGIKPAPEGFEQYLLKLDAKIEENELKPESSYYCRLEYSYYKMALACGIEMQDSMLIESGQRSHFLTKRFDRTKVDGNEEKVHMVSLTGMCHYDFNIPQSTSYEQLFEAMRGLKLPKQDFEQVFRRMVFNVVACNNDDHPKNFSFLLPKGETQWQLSPAYDLTFACKKGHPYLGMHQMTLCGKSRVEDIYKSDLEYIGKQIGIRRPIEIIDQITDIVDNMEQYMDKRIPQEIIDRIQAERSITNKQIKTGLHI